MNTIHTQDTKRFNRDELLFLMEASRPEPPPTPRQTMRAFVLPKYIGAGLAAGAVLVALVRVFA